MPSGRYSSTSVRRWNRTVLLDPFIVFVCLLLFFDFECNWSLLNIHCYNKMSLKNNVCGENTSKMVFIATTWKTRRYCIKTNSGIPPREVVRTGYCEMPVFIFITDRRKSYPIADENTITILLRLSTLENDRTFFTAFQVIIQSIKEHKRIEWSEAEKLLFEWHWEIYNIFRFFLEKFIINFLNFVGFVSVVNIYISRHSFPIPWAHQLQPKIFGFLALLRSYPKRRPVPDVYWNAISRKNRFEN